MADTGTGDVENTRPDTETKPVEIKAEAADTKDETVEKTAAVEEETEDSKVDEANSSTASLDPYYPPIIYLPEIEINAGEDDEDEVIKIRAKLYRYAHECDPPEWKERGTGDIRILINEELHTARVVMRREKTLKVCANHFILPWMELRKNCSSEKAWIWKTQADFADEEYRQETLAARFANVEKAKKWETAFEQCKKYVLEKTAEKFLNDKGEDTSSFNKADENKENEGENQTNKKEEVETKGDKVATELEKLTVSQD